MAYSRNNPRRSNGSGCKDCDEKDNPTQKTISRERNTVCNLMYEAAGEVSKQQEKFGKEKELYNFKKCLFVNTEDNFRRYRNMDIVVGSELIQTNESVKANVAALNKWNKDLNAVLKNIAKGVKDSKAKFAELRKAANDLKNCMEDSCNKAQKKALTGRSSDDCKDETKPPEECREAGTIIDELICIPQGLGADIDSIFKSSHDVVGIQVFSNIETLEPLQKTLEEQSKAFKTHIGDVAKLRETDLKKQQEELVKSVQDITKAAMDRNTARSTFEGYYDAVDFLCCPVCKCVQEWDDDRKGCDGCDPRLGKCEKDICKICEEVKVTFCCDPKDKNKSDNRHAAS